MRNLISLCCLCVRISFPSNIPAPVHILSRRTGERKAEKGGNVFHFPPLSSAPSTPEKALTQKHSFIIISSQLNATYLFFRTAARHFEYIRRRMNTGHRCMVHKFPTGLLPVMCHAFVPGFYFLKYLSSQEGYYSHFSERMNCYDNVTANTKLKINIWRLIYANYKIQIL